jgi:hypothetical protein
VPALDFPPSGGCGGGRLSASNGGSFNPHEELRFPSLRRKTLPRRGWGSGCALILERFVGRRSMRFTRRVNSSASVSVFGQRGVSLLQVDTLRPEIDCNCVAVRRGGEQQEVNEQPVVIKPVSACRVGEPARQWRSPDSIVIFPIHSGQNMLEKPVALRGCVRKRQQGRRGGWRRND